MEYKSNMYYVDPFLNKVHLCTYPVHAHYYCCGLTEEEERKKGTGCIQIYVVSFIDAQGCWKSYNGLWVSECGILNLSCERINLASNMNTVTDITNAYI